MSPPSYPLGETTQVTPPVAPGPAKTLLQVLWALLKCCLYQRLRVVLKRDSPPFLDYPPCYKVVVICIKFPPLPGLVAETFKELFVFYNAGTVGDSSSREARHGPIYMVHCCTVEISSFEIKRSKEAPNALAPVPSIVALETLAGSNSANLRLCFEWSNHPLKDSRRPIHVIICKDGEIRFDKFYPDCQLLSFIWVSYCFNLEPGRSGIYFLKPPFYLLVVDLDGHQYDFLWTICNDRSDCLC